jgi:hypothetical protein
MLAQIPYVVRVFTSDLKGAGTDASIDVGVIGSRGETGWHRLVANHDTFERAQVGGGADSRGPTGRRLVDRICTQVGATGSGDEWPTVACSML